MFTRTASTRKLATRSPARAARTGTSSRQTAKATAAITTATPSRCTRAKATFPAPLTSA